MSDSIEAGVQDAIGGAAQRVAGGVHHVVEPVQSATSKAQSGADEVREAIRARPIAVVLVVFALSYLFGRFAP